MRLMKQFIMVFILALFAVFIVLSLFGCGSQPTPRLSYDYHCKPGDITVVKHGQVTCMDRDSISDQIFM